jgi:signal transduction histidine kinase
VTDLPVAAAKDTAEMLNVRSFIVAPMRYRERIRGRILVGSIEPGRFDVEDATLLEQAADQILPVIENIRLVDRLASDAAEEERRKIARSVHDRVIQPYLGLQIGLKALQQELFGPERAAVGPVNRGAALLDRLVSMTREGIEELRQYVTGLKQSSADEAMLMDSIRRFAGKFESATGIHVEVADNACGLTMNDRLSAEVFQMTAEALSNVHRHTDSRSAQVRLTLSDKVLELSVENDASAVSPVPFSPLSIFERAEALGGRTEILWPAGKTQVRVEVPL